MPSSKLAAASMSLTEVGRRRFSSADSSARNLLDEPFATHSRTALRYFSFRDVSPVVWFRRSA